jgi:ankyrin repeat protein
MRTDEAEDGWALPARAKQVLEAFNLLFEHGAQLQDDDRNILFFPAAGGHTEIVRLLLEHGASPSWSPSVGTELTSVEYAQKEGFNDIVALLVEHGAEPLRTEQAIQVRFIETAKSGSVADLKKLILEAAQVNGQNSDSQTPLISAIDGGQ